LILGAECSSWASEKIVFARADFVHRNRSLLLGWYTEFITAPQLIRRTHVLFATLFFLLFAALPAMRAIKEGALSEIDILLTTVNAFLYVGALRLFWPTTAGPSRC